MSDPTPDLRTIRDFAATSGFSFNQMRYLIYNSELNGLEDSGALVRIGKRIWINVARFYEWALSSPTTDFSARISSEKKAKNRETESASA